MELTYCYDSYGSELHVFRQMRLIPNYDFRDGNELISSTPDKETPKCDNCFMTGSTSMEVSP